MRAVRLPLEGERAVRRVAELVRERDDVAEAPREVQQDERQDLLRDGRAVRAARLAGARRRVDVAGIEALAEDLGEPRRESRERAVDDLDRLRPRKVPALADRRVLVGELEPVEPEQPRLRLEPPPAERVALLRRGDHRVHRGRVELVAHVRRLHRIGEAAHAVEPEPVADERVVAGCQHLRARLEPLVQRLERAAAQLPLRPVHVREDHVHGVRLDAVAPVERDLERRDLAVVQRRPRRDGRRARVQRLLLRLAQDVRLLVPQRAQLVREARELRRREQRLGGLVVERDPFEIDEDELVLDVGAALARERREIVRLDVGRVHVHARAAVDEETRRVLLEQVALVEELPQPGRVELGDPAAVPLGERGRARDELRPLRPRLVRARAELGEVPAHLLDVVRDPGHSSRNLVQFVRVAGGEPVEGPQAVVRLQQLGRVADVAPVALEGVPVDRTRGTSHATNRPGWSGELPSPR